MQISSSISTAADWRQALEQAAAEVTGALDGPPDLALLFVSHDRAADSSQIAREACRALDTTGLLGCTGESIVGSRTEIERAPALSMWAARLPGVRRQLMHLQFERTPDGGSIIGWPDSLLASWPDESTLLMLGEPFSFPADLLLERLAADQPQCTVVGGMASGGHGPGQNRLLLGERAVDDGAAAVLLDGPLQVRRVVSQGCRPIGEPYVVTKADRNLIIELGGRPAVQQLEQLFHSLPNREQSMAQQGLHIGRVVNEYQESFESGDFLIRNVVGIDPDTGAVAASDFFRVGQTVQFHLRDQESADLELSQMLRAARQQTAAAGGLLFTCNGRGERMFQTPHHDAQAVAEHFGDLPLAGLFAQGEIGPVGGRSFLHGFTASLALFQPPPPEGGR